MESDVGPFDNLKITMRNNIIVLRRIFRDFDYFIKENKFNFISLILFTLTVLAYEFLSVILDVAERESYLATSKNYLSFDPYLTIFFQNILGTNSILSIISVYFYTFGFILLTASAFILLSLTIIRKKEYRRREPYIYVSVLLIMTLIDISAYWIIPTAPPVRIYSDLFFRKNILPLGESLITIKYNSLPSGHIYSLTIPYLFSKAENFKNWKNIFATGLIATSWIILFTGDHYAIDIFASYFLCLLFFTILSLVYDYFNKGTIKPPRNIIIKRLKSLLLTLVVLIFISIITIEYINEYMFIFQLFCILIVWPVLVLKTNTDGLFNNNTLIDRSLLTDLKDVKRLVHERKNSSNSVK